MTYIIEEYRPIKEKGAIVHTEVNLKKWPQLFATRHTRGLSRVIERGDSKVIIGRQMTNKGTEIEVGFLIAKDLVTINGLIYLWELNDRPQVDRISGRATAFVKHILQQTPGGSTLREFERSLKRLVDTPINWVNAFFDSRTGKLESITDYKFRFLQELKITKRKLPGQKLEFATFAFRFNQSFLQNLLSGATKPFNMSELGRINGELAILAYAFFDIIMADKAHWSRRVTKFIQEDLQNISPRYRKPSNCKQAVEEIIHELNNCHLTTGVLTLSLRRAKDGKDWRLDLHKKGPRVPAAPQDTSLAARRAQVDDLQAQELFVKIATVCGREKKNAVWYRQLIHYYPSDLIRAALRDTTDERRSGNIMTSNAAFFSWWIQELGEKHGIPKIKGHIHATRE